MFITLTGDLSWQRLRRSGVDFCSKNEKNRSLSHPLGHLRVTYVLHLWLVGKPMVNFIFVVIELFSLSPTVETLWAEICRSRRFSKGWVTLNADFRGKGASPTNHCWCQSSRVIVLSCGIKISVVCHLVLSQCTCVTDGQTDGRTELRQQYCALHYMQSHGNKNNTKTWRILMVMLAVNIILSSKKFPTFCHNVCLY